MNSTECRNRAENVLMHTFGRYPVVLDHGEGVYLYDTDGNSIWIFPQVSVYLPLVIRTKHTMMR